MCFKSCVFAIVVVMISIGVECDVLTNEIYSIDLVGGTQQKSLAISASKRAVLEAYDSSNGRERFIARINSDKTFTLFSEVQPWDWVDHIVELSKTVNIKETPQCLDVIQGTKEVLEGNYRNDNAQRWYINPIGDGPDEGLLANLLTRLCLVADSDNKMSVGICDFNDPNQHFRLTKRTQGRCY